MKQAAEVVKGLLGSLLWKVGLMPTLWHVRNTACTLEIAGCNCPFLLTWQATNT